jgi:CubicO group peptidase (beta-lactamase class C family)
LLASVTKGFAALCVQVLEDRGELDVDARVAHYWPEFAQAGKDAVTVRQLLLHTAGVIGFATQNQVVRWDGTGWDDYDAIAAGLAAARPVWEPGTIHGYHAVSYGWLLGELVRRISGLTLGTLFAKEVAAPLELDAYCGIDGATFPRVAATHDALSETDNPLTGAVLKFLGRKMRDPRNWLGYAFLGDGSQSIMDAAGALSRSPRWLAAEVPASNGVATAGALAKMFAMLGAGGELGGVRVVSEASVRRFTQPQLRSGDAVMAAAFPKPFRRLATQTTITRGLGYSANELPLAKQQRFGPSPSAFGVQGAGGQIAFADPEHGLAFGFVRTRMIGAGGVLDALIDTTYRCHNG